MNKPVHPGRRLRQAGMTLVEVLVACAVGLLVALAVTVAVVSSSRQFTIIGGTAAAQSSVQVGLSLLEQGGRSAGAGFYSNGMPICPTWNAYNGSTIKSNGDAFMPVRIVAGANERASDTIIFTGGTGGSRALAAAPVLAPVLGAAADINIPASGGFAVGDYAIIGAPGTGQPCTLFEIRNLPATPAGCPGVATECQQVVRTPNQGINPGPVDFAQRPNFGFDATAPGPAVFAPAVVSRVGSTTVGFRQDAFAIACQSLVRYNAFDFVPPAGPWCSSSPMSFANGLEAIAGDVVLLQAQYGVSSGPNAARNIVDEWVDPADPAWAAPSVGDIARIKAVRLVMVSRSREPAGEVVTAPCTNGAAVVNQGPCSFEDARAPVVDLSAVPVPAGRTWQHFRYRAHTAVIPLRSVIWSGSS